MLQTSEQINELAAALAVAQGQFENPTKDARNPYYNSKYADLAGVLNAVRGPLANNGLAVVQAAEFVSERNAVAVTSTLMHSSGQWVQSTLEMPVVREKKGEGFVAANDPQALGLAITYARRYAIAALVLVAQEDDDGNAASRTHEMDTAPARNERRSDKPAPPKPTKNAATSPQTEEQIIAAWLERSEAAMREGTLADALILKVKAHDPAKLPQSAKDRIIHGIAAIANKLLEEEATQTQGAAE